MLSEAFDKAWSENGVAMRMRIDNVFLIDIMVDPQGEEALSDKAPEFLATGLETPSTVLKKLKQGMMVKKLPKGWIQDSWVLVKEATMSSPSKIPNKKSLTALQETVLKMLSLFFLGASEDCNE